jgi:decaprenyl-phosphate phosphoribosyltransferase
MEPMPLALNNKPVLLGLVKLLRPKQWLKNSFVLAPLVFSGEFFHLAALGQAAWALVLFCLGASAVYIVNDLHDVNCDKLHAGKAISRPLASGLVTRAQALALLSLLYVALLIGYFLLPKVTLVIFIYMLLNVAYTWVLKYEPVLDIFSIALGFVLRVYAGGVALAVPLSAWMLVTTLCLALYLAAVKRRQELLMNHSQTRHVLQSYSVALIERYAQMAATGALLFYSLFVMTVRPEMTLTIPFVLFGLFRYWFVVEAKAVGESPTDVLLSDWQLFFTVLLWVVACLWVLWPAA